MNNLVVDTNILIYALDKSSRYDLAPRSLLFDDSKYFFITTKSISEYFAVASKFGVDIDLAFRFYKEILSNCIVLFPSSVSLAVLENLIQKYRPHRTQIYDLEIVSVMLAHDIVDIAS